jgi:hypothetical protein
VSNIFEDNYENDPNLLEEVGIQTCQEFVHEKLV